jgi:hypothetical protein
MLSKYVEYKLMRKVKTHLSLAGLDTNVDITSLVEKIKEFGDYKITWTQNVPTDIKMYDKPHKVRVESGKYFILNEDGSFINQLYSSEFIDFDIKEMREYKLNKILKEI